MILINWMIIRKYIIIMAIIIILKILLPYSEFSARNARILLLLDE